MKSLLQEAPSIERAISQAWESAGRPQEFSVKIHEQGKRGFLGFSSEPAVVSITYKPLVAAGAAAAPARPSRNAGSRNSEHGRDERRSGGDRHERHDRHDSERSERMERSERPDRSERLDASDRSERLERSDRGERNERGDRNDRRRSGDRRDAGRRGDRSSSGGAAGARSRGLLSYVEGEENSSTLNADATNMGSYAEATEHQSSSESSFHVSSHDDNGMGDAWEASYVESINAWLNEIIATIGYDVTFESSVSGKVLHVQFATDFVADPELSRSLYAALSFVLLQFLKREHKRRFRGLRIALTHPGQEPLRFDLGS